MQLQKIKRIIVLTGVLSLLILLQNFGFAADNADIIEYVGPPKITQIYADPVSNKQYTPPPASFYQYQTLNVENITTTDIQITYIGSWSNGAKNAFEYAASIWESQIDSTIPIQIEAEMSSLPSGFLGVAFWASLVRDFTDAPVPNTWYTVSLANALREIDSNGTDPEIFASFSTDAAWYYGTDGNTPTNKYDFVSVALHEIGHGLGFSDSMNINGGIGSWGYTDSSGTFPIIYDRFIDTGNSTLLISGFSNNSAALAGQLTSNNLYFDGPFANSANGGRTKVYAPTPWEGGSSIAHLDLATYLNTPNSLMTPKIGLGEARHDPGAVTLGILRDIGWLPPNKAPIISQLPAILIQIGSSKDNAIDLWQYVADEISNDSDLTYEIIAQSNPDAGASVDSNRYIDINPIPTNWEGSSTLTVKVTDTDNLSTQASISVISGDISYIFLPIVTK